MLAWVYHIKVQIQCSSGLRYKDDWDEAKKRMAAWWEGETAERPLIQVLTPRGPEGGSEQLPWLGFDNWDLARHPDEPDMAIDEFERWCSQTHFGGEAYPNFWVNLGAGVMGAYLGAEVKFKADTVWFGAQWDERFVRNWGSLANVEFNENEVWWRRTVSATRRAIERCRGNFIVGVTDLGGIGDIIASLRGPKNLLIDCHLRPDDIKSLSERLVEIWHVCYDRLFDIIGRSNPGSSAWMGIWSPLKWYPLQCDFAAMLSPRKFDDLVLPYLKEQCQRLDHALYHLDGPGQLCHLNSLLRVDELRAIQWVPGAGEELQGYHCGSEKWLSLYEKILAAGKGLVLALPSAYVEPVTQKLRSSKVLFQTTASSQTEADALLKRSSQLMRH